MAGDLMTLKTRVVQVWKQFGPGQRFNVLLALLATVAVIGGLIYWSSIPDYRLLYSDLSLADAAKMREKLEESSIPVKIGQSGMSISVPSSELYSARLLLASSGLPQDSSSGFELFEEPKFGLTDFAQKVNYQRALQGELERTVSAMQGIRSARVMLVLPKDRLFASTEEKKAQASILLNLNGSIALADAQVQSIIHLVSGSVQGLAPSDVVVTDQNGRMLSRVSAAEDILEQSSEQLALQERTEKRLEEKAQAILDRAMGVGNSIVRISVELDFSDVEEEAQLFDAANRVAKTESIMSEDQTGGGGGGAGGASGVMANVSVGNPDSMKVDEKDRNKKEELLTEYVIPSTVSRTRRKGVSIEQMSVAICLAEGETPRSDEQMTEISLLMASALGVDQQRHDSIEVSEMAFQPQEPPVQIAQSWWQQLPFSLNSLMQGLGGIVILGVVFGVGRRVKKAVLESAPQIDLPVEELQRRTQEELEKESPMSLQEQLAAITEVARKNPKTVAGWISNSVNWNE